MGGAGCRGRSTPFCLHDRITRPRSAGIVGHGPIAGAGGTRVDGATVGGRVLDPGAHIAVGAGPLLEIVEVEHPDAHMNFAVALGGPDVRALQLVWADDRGRWPWAANWGNRRRRQPVLGVRAQKA